jgi:hypothetical protein
MSGGKDMMPVEDHRRVVEALIAEHRIQLGAQSMKTAACARLLEENGIPLPEGAPKEFLQLWQNCESVISTATTFVEHLGTTKELYHDGVYAFVGGSDKRGK